MDKRASTWSWISIILIIIVVVVLGWSLIKPLVPGSEAAVNGGFEAVCDTAPILGTCKGGYFISSFSGDRALDGTLKLGFRFVKDSSGKSDMSYYSLKEKDITGGAGGTEPAETEIKKGGIDDTSYQVTIMKDGAGEERPAALVPKTYTLAAIGEDGSVLESTRVDYKGAFPGIYQSDRARYDASIASFIELATGLKTASGDFSKTINLHKELMIISFNREFNYGKGRYKDFRTFSCPGADIDAPKECKEAKSCLCLCLKSDRCETGRLCYGYELDFIGGSERNCGMSSWFGPKGKDGEDNQQIEIYKEESFEDKNNEFNSLAMVNKGDSSGVALSIRLDSRTLRTDQITRAIISKA
jgi:hypothetical protein